MTDNIPAIEKIMELALKTTLDGEKVNAIDTLATYGEHAIEAIAEIGSATTMDSSKGHAFDIIRKIKEHQT